MSDNNPTPQAPIDIDHSPVAGRSSAPKPKKKGKKKYIVLGLLGLAVIGGVAANKGGSSKRVDPANASAVSTTGKAHEVVYEVTGNGTSSADVTVIDADFNTHQTMDAALPLMSESGKTGLHFQMDKYESYSLVAQNNESDGSVTCTVKVDGATVRTNASSGPYAVVTCAGTV